MSTGADPHSFLHSPSPPASRPDTPGPPGARSKDDDDADAPLATPAAALFSAAPSRPSADALRADLRARGFCVVRNFLPPSAQHGLRAAAASATAAARAGHWPFLRTLPKQFPPWGADARAGIWGVQHLLHPRMPGRDAFAAAYFAPELLGACRALLRARDEHLVLELLNLLVRPERDFALRWHRDAVPFGAHEGSRLAELARDEPGHVQYNIPLFPDDSLVLVPGSHARARTPAEAALLEGDACAPALPGMLVVSLRPGDCVFYDNNVIHRGVYRADTERLTLHGSVGDARGGTARAQNVLQHAVGDWIDECDFACLGDEDDPTRQRAEAMRQRLVDLGREAGGAGKAAIHDD